jgi:hypothetical protein
MLNIFNNRPADVKGIRSALLQFIKEQLQKNEGGEGGIIKTIQLYITCSDAERHVYESAVYEGISERFKNEEVQRIADDFAIALPSDWKLDIQYAEAPLNAIKASNIDVAMVVITNRTQVKQKTAVAYIKVLNGDTPQPVYIIRSDSGKINIGREEKVQAADGFFRKNYIAFKTDSSNASNKSISRQHAHIEWDAETGSFYLYADEGGIPPHNKMKVRSEGGEPWKLQTTEIGYRLQEGDQVILGESAVIEFTYLENAN